MEHRNSEWKHDINVAKELLYPYWVIEALKHERDPFKRSKILTNARKESIKKGGT